MDRARYTNFRTRPAADFDELWTRGLLIRRDISDGDLAFFSTWCPQGRPWKHWCGSRGPPLGDRGQFRDREERAWPRSRRDALVARLAPPCCPGHAGLRHGRHPASCQCRTTPKNDAQAPSPPPDPMAYPGTPPHHQSHGTASNPARTDHRMVIVAKGASGPGKTGSYQTENATVILL